MSAAGEAVRAALARALAAQNALAGVDGLGRVPVVGTLPRITLDDPVVTDWGTKSARGREVRTTVTIRVATGQRARLPEMVAAAEAAGEALGGAIKGWAVGSAVLTRSRIVDESSSVRAGQVEHRIRILETQGA